MKSIKFGNNNSDQNLEDDIFLESKDKSVVKLTDDADEILEDEVFSKEEFNKEELLERLKEEIHQYVLDNVPKTKQDEYLKHMLRDLNQMKDSDLFEEPENLKPKKAYPNSEYYIDGPGEHNTSKWLHAVKSIYAKEKEGLSKSRALQQVTSGWKETEQLDFKNWLRFYEGNNHLKYKFAEKVVYDGGPGYYLSFNSEPAIEEKIVTGNDINSIKEEVNAGLTEKEKKQLIEKQRKKIIGRLDSVEKLLRSDDGHLFADKELENLMETIYNLKKKVNLLNKKSTSTKLYQDMIIREANILVKKGFSDAADLLYALAEDPKSPPSSPSTTLPPPPPPAPPAQGSGSAGAGLTPLIPAGINSTEAPKNESSPPSAAGVTPPADPAAAPPPPPAPPSDASMPTLSLPLPSAPSADSPSSKKEGPKSKGMSKFLSGLEEGGSLTEADKNSADDLEVVDYNQDYVDDILDDQLFVEAQVAPELVTSAPTPTPIAPAAPLPPAAPETLEVSEEDIPSKPVERVSNSGTEKLQVFDKRVNDLFSNVTVEDIISKLEDLSKIFKVREVPRQLSIVDMMLDSIGLSSYFPDLSEATNKALESNNYISTRIDNILAKLQGAVKSRKIDLYGQETEVKPEIKNIQQQLQSDQNKEKIRKDLRKRQELEDAMLESKETPEVEIEEGPGGAPVAPAPVAPPAAPAAIPPRI